MDLVYYKKDVFNHEEWIEEFLRNLVFETILPHSMGLTKEWLRAGFDRTFLYTMEDDARKRSKCNVNPTSQNPPDLVSRADFAKKDLHYI